jgi:hypothetical protein
VRQYVVAEDDAKQGAGVYQLACMDILFQHPRSVHFTNHRDTKATSGLINDLVITIVWLISPNGSSSLRVAGAADAAKMDRPGTGHMFVSDMFHRTDVTTTGTVKVTCFFQRTQVKPAKAPAKAVKAAASNAEAPQVPQETKQKDVPEPTLFHPVRSVEEGAEGEEDRTRRRRRGRRATTRRRARRRGRRRRPTRQHRIQTPSDPRPRRASTPVPFGRCLARRSPQTRRAGTRWAGRTRRQHRQRRQRQPRRSSLRERSAKWLWRAQHTD